MNQQPDGGISKVKLALGAASLFFFLVGLKRSFRNDDGTEILSNGDVAPTPEPPGRQTTLRNAS